MPCDEHVKIHLRDRVERLSQLGPIAAVGIVDDRRDRFGRRDEIACDDGPRRRQRDSRIALRVTAEFVQLEALAAQRQFGVATMRDRSTARRIRRAMRSRDAIVSRPPPAAARIPE